MDAPGLVVGVVGLLIINVVPVASPWRLIYCDTQYEESEQILALC